MPEINLVLSEEENRKVELFKAKHGLSSKTEAIKRIIQLHKLNL